VTNYVSCWNIIRLRKFGVKMKLKKGISIWAFPSDWSLEYCFLLAVEAGFDGIELAYASDGPITPDSTEAALGIIRKEAETSDIEISSLASGIFWQVNMISDDAEERQQAKKHLVRMLEIASTLELGLVLIVPGFIGPFEAGPPVVSDYEVGYQRAVDIFREISPLAQRLGVDLGVENVWNKFLSSAHEMKSFLDLVESPNVGCYFDVGNCLRTGYPEQWIRILGSRIKGVHFKDFRVNVGNLQGFVDLFEGDVDFEAVMGALQEIGYQGYCIVELFTRPHYPETVVKRAGADIHKVFEGWVK
jgi:hexulose-6-phosphate isomerase